MRLHLQGMTKQDRKRRIYRSQACSLKSLRMRYMKPSEMMKMNTVRLTCRSRRWPGDNQLFPGRWTTLARLSKPLATLEGSHSSASRTTPRNAPSGTHSRRWVTARKSQCTSAHNQATKSRSPTTRSLPRRSASNCTHAHSIKRTWFRAKLSQSWGTKTGKRQLQQQEASEMSFEWIETLISYNDYQLMWSVELIGAFII